MVSPFLSRVFFAAFIFFHAAVGFVGSKERQPEHTLSRTCFADRKPHMPPKKLVPAAAAAKVPNKPAKALVVVESETEEEEELSDSIDLDDSDGEEEEDDSLHTSDEDMIADDDEEDGAELSEDEEEEEALEEEESTSDEEEDEALSLASDEEEDEGATSEEEEDQGGVVPEVPKPVPLVEVVNRARAEQPASTRYPLRRQIKPVQRYRDEDFDELMYADDSEEERREAKYWISRDADGKEIVSEVVRVKAVPAKRARR